MYIIIFIVFVIASAIVGNQLKSRFRKYSKLPVAGGLTGAEVAAKMLQDNGLYDVNVTMGHGQLTDHYNPANKTVTLSPDVYNGRNVSAAAVAAHECGHAVQHARAYAPLQLRSTLVPLQNVSAKIMNAIFIMMFLGAFIVQQFPFQFAILIIIGCYAVFTLFSFITLPVEVNASNRALEWLESTKITNSDTHDKARDALKWAAYTYLVSALSSLAMLLYFLSVFAGGND